MDAALSAAVRQRKELWLWTTTMRAVVTGSGSEPVYVVCSARTVTVDSFERIRRHFERQRRTSKPISTSVH